MELEQVIRKIKHNDITSKELLEWKSQKDFNLWHALATLEGTDLFAKISKKVPKSQLIHKLSEKNTLGDCPVHIAAWSHNLRALQCVSQVMNGLDALDAQQRNAAMICLKTRNPETIDFCLQQTHDIKQKDCHGHDLLCYAQVHAEPGTCQKIVDMVGSRAAQPSTALMLQGESEDTIVAFVQNNKKTLVQKKV